MNKCNHCQSPLKVGEDYCEACGNFVDLSTPLTPVVNRTIPVANRRPDPRNTLYNRTSKKSSLNSFISFACTIAFVIIAVVVGTKYYNSFQIKNYYNNQLNEFRELFDYAAQNAQNLGSSDAEVLRNFEDIQLVTSQDMLDELNSINVPVDDLEEAHQYLIEYTTLRIEVCEATITALKTNNIGLLQQVNTLADEANDKMEAFNNSISELLPDYDLYFENEG